MEPPEPLRAAPPRDAGRAETGADPAWRRDVAAPAGSTRGPHLADDPDPGATAGGGGPGLSVVVPCYNEEAVLAELHRRVSAACGPTGVDYELVLVNDGSTDRTWPRMVALAGSDPRLVLVNLSRNHGHQLALSAGLDVCRGRRVLILDADLQDPPELLAEMMRMMDDGADVVYGRRLRREGESAFKRISAALFYRLIERLTDARIPRDTGDFRLISRRALDVLTAMPERHRFLRGMIGWVGFRQEPLLSCRQPRFAGETKYSLPKMLRLAADAITSFSIKPLAVAAWLGVASAFGACLLLALALVSWRAGWGAAGPALQSATTLLMGSVQLFALAIFGQYLGRMYEQVKGRPLFIIERIVRGRAPSADVAGGDRAGEPDEIRPGEVARPARAAPIPEEAESSRRDGRSPWNPRGPGV